MFKKILEDSQFKTNNGPWPGGSAHWTHQKVMSSIPSQGMYRRQVINVSLSLKINMSSEMFADSKFWPGLHLVRACTTYWLTWDLQQAVQNPTQVLLMQSSKG